MLGGRKKFGLRESPPLGSRLGTMKKLKSMSFLQPMGGKGDRREMSMSATAGRRRVASRSTMTGRVFHLNQSDLMDVVSPKHKKIDCFCDSELMKKDIPFGPGYGKMTLKRKMLRQLVWAHKSVNEGMAAIAVHLPQPYGDEKKYDDGGVELIQRMGSNLELAKTPRGKVAFDLRAAFGSVDDVCAVSCRNCEAALTRMKSKKLKNRWFECTLCKKVNSSDGKILAEFKYIWHCSQAAFDDVECDNLCEACYSKKRVHQRRERRRMQAMDLDLIEEGLAVGDEHQVLAPVTNQMGSVTPTDGDSKDEFSFDIDADDVDDALDGFEKMKPSFSIRKDRIQLDDETGERLLVCFCGGDWNKTTATEAMALVSSTMECTPKAHEKIRCNVCGNLQKSSDDVYGCHGAHYLCTKCYAMELECPCVCGEACFQVFRASEVYQTTDESKEESMDSTMRHKVSHRNVPRIHCDGCRKTYESQEKVYHCQNGMCEEHPTAVDLCYKCIRQMYSNHLAVQSASEMSTDSTSRDLLARGLSAHSSELRLSSRTSQQSKSSIERPQPVFIDSIESKPNCYCGAAYKYTSAGETGFFESEYGYGCDVCEKLHFGEEKLFHCVAGLSKDHESGSFLCADCLIKEKTQPCVCENASMDRWPKKKIYESGYVVCDFCCMSIDKGNFAYHCSREEASHPHGFDLCMDCMDQFPAAMDLVTTEAGDEIQPALEEMDGRRESADLQKRKLFAAEIRCHSCDCDTRGETAWVCRNLLLEKYKTEDRYSHCVLCEYCHVQILTLTTQVQVEHSRDVEKAAESVSEFMSSAEKTVIRQSTRSASSGSYNWFLPNATLKRMVFPRYKRDTLDPRSLKLIWCDYEPGNLSIKSERMAYIQVKVNDILIDEQLARGKAQVSVEMTATLYWLFSRNDYNEYGKKPKHGERREFKPSWIPEIEIYNENQGSYHGGADDGGGEDGKKTRKCTAVSMQSFFGGDIDSRLYAERNTHRFVDCRKLRLQTEIDGDTWVWAVNESKDIYLVPLNRIPDGLILLWMFPRKQKHPSFDDFEMGVIFERYEGRGPINRMSEVKEDEEMGSQSQSKSESKMPSWPWLKGTGNYCVSLSRRGDLRLSEYRPKAANQVFRLRAFVGEEMWLKPNESAHTKWFNNEVALFCLSARGCNSICYEERDGGKNPDIKLLTSRGRSKDPQHYFTFKVDSTTHTPLLSNFVGFGLMNRYSFDISTTMTEPFELGNYPFDFQDIPVSIRAKNFAKMLPAFYGHSLVKDWSKRDDSRFVVYTTSDAVDCGALQIENTVTEFVDKLWEKDELRILFKAKRNSHQIVLTHGFLMLALTALNLTVFSIDADLVAERLAHVLTLLLAFMFIDYPKTPVFTYLDMLFYSMFALSIFVAIQCAAADKLPGNDTLLPVFSALFVVVLFFFTLRASRVRAYERSKTTMDSIQVEKEVSLKMRALTQGTISRLPTVRESISGPTSLEREYMLTPKMRSDNENESVLLYKSVRKVKPTQFLSEQLTDELWKFNERAPNWRVATYFLCANALQLFTVIWGTLVTSACQKTSTYKAHFVTLFVLLLIPALLVSYWRKKQKAKDRDKDKTEESDEENFDPWNFVSFCVGFALFWVQWAMAARLTMAFSKPGRFDDCRRSVWLLFWLFLVWDFLYAAALLSAIAYFVQKCEKFERLALGAGVTGFVSTVLLPGVSTLMALLAFNSGDSCHLKQSTFGYKEVVSMIAMVAFFISGIPITVLMIAWDFGLTRISVFCGMIFLDVLALFGMHCHALSFWANASTECSTQAWVDLWFALFCLPLASSKTMRRSAILPPTDIYYISEANQGKEYVWNYGSFGICVL